ncbi:unnamed protein product [Linum trigynum]|uniref:Uncharacterized protein n=1 Tax=Linum trigynum TaxID=586398 RepID=A0AAV2CLJ8_9ROSI
MGCSARSLQLPLTSIPPPPVFFFPSTSSSRSSLVSVPRRFPASELATTALPIIVFFRSSYIVQILVDEKLRTKRR